MSDDPTADTAASGAAETPSTAAPLGFIKVEVARCSAQTKAGQPCRAPAAGGSPWCVNHRLLMDPTYVPPLSKDKAREVAIQERIAVLRVEREREEKEARRRAPKQRRPLLEAIAERLELAPEHIAQVVEEGLRATKTKRVRRLNEDGTQAAVVEVGERGGVHEEPIFDDVEEPDHETRLLYLREVADRLYGKPTQAKLVEGAVDVNVNVGSLLAAARSLETNSDDYYASLPAGELPEPTIDVGEGIVVESEPPV
jgi:hypothetical protein